MPLIKRTYVADFETTTRPDDLRVWASCLVDIDDLSVPVLANNIDDFMHYFENKLSVVYFHNLKFDGEFIISYLLNNGYTHSDVAKPKTFSTLITEQGLFYSITVVYEVLNKKYKKVTFFDSLKKLPFKVSVIAKAFELEESKGEIDYKAERKLGHVLTEEEIDYIKKDCTIVAQALKIQFDQGLTKMTNASDAMSDYKTSIGKKQFERNFPTFPLELDADLRQAYKGGFTYLNPRYANKRIKGGVTLDVNSLYPSRMYYELLPWGYPVTFFGEYEHDPDFPLYIARIRCAFQLKPGHIPTIQIKKGGWYKATEYLTSSATNDDPETLQIVEMTVTNVDLQLMKDHYELLNYEMIKGWKFHGKHGMFTKYIDYWMRIKENSTGAIRQLAKLMLNSLYGKFASNPKHVQKLPYLDADGVVKYHVTDPEYKEPVYTAVAAFITAYARNVTIRAAQTVYDRFIYADTDSLHLVGTDIPEGLEVHPTKLGAWKHEGTFTDSYFIRAKTYMETIDGVDHVTCAGMPENVKQLVTYDNFKGGSVFPGKLVPRRYPGGVILTETNFTIQK